MENMFQPFEILISEENELIVLVEPEGELISALENENLSVELDVDVDYDDEDEELYLLFTVYLGENEIFFAIPYGEAWNILVEKGNFQLAFISQTDFDNKKFENVPTITIELDDLTLGFVEGCQRTAEVLLGENFEE